MADKVNAGQAGPTAAAAVESLIRVYCCQCLAILHPESFILQVDLVGFFEGGDSLVDGSTSCLAVISKSRTLVMVVSDRQ